MNMPRPQLPATATRELPSLNYDVLLIIIEHLKRGDLFQLMHTCHTLHDLGIPSYLGRPITLFNILQLSSFCNFLLDHPTRIRYLRSLTLLLYNLPGPGSTPNDRLRLGMKISEVFIKAQNLEYLGIFNAKEFFEIAPELLAQSVFSLGNLRHLALHGVTSLDASIFRSLQSPIAEIGVSFRFDIKDGASNEETLSAMTFADPIEKLANFKDYLTTMSLEFVRFQITAVRYLNVHTLYLDKYDGVNLTILTRCFPNVQYFRLGVEFKDMRRPTVIGGWPTLRVLHSKVRSVRNLGLGSKVRTWSGVTLDSVDEAQFHESLGDLRPDCVEMFLETLYMQVDLERLFPVSPITHLTVVAELDGFLKPSIYLRKLSTSVSNLKLRFLCLGVRHVVWSSEALYQWDIAFRDLADDVTTCTARGRPKNSQGLDLEECLRKLSSRSPELRYIFLSFSSGFGTVLNNAFLEVVRDSAISDVRFRRLSASDVTRIVEEDDLEPSSFVSWLTRPGTVWEQFVRV